MSEVSLDDLEESGEELSLDDLGLDDLALEETGMDEMTKVIAAEDFLSTVAIVSPTFTVSPGDTRNFSNTSGSAEVTSCRSGNERLPLPVTDSL